LEDKSEVERDKVLRNAFQTPTLSEIPRLGFRFPYEAVCSV
jgi:hypothetical protein